MDTPQSSTTPPVGQSPQLPPLPPLEPVQPLQDPAASAPPPATASPAVSLPVPAEVTEEEDTLDELSPTNILQKSSVPPARTISIVSPDKSSEPQVTPPAVPVQPSAAAPTQAPMVTPGNTFILPKPQEIAPAQPAVTAPLPVQPAMPVAPVSVPLPTAVPPVRSTPTSPVTMRPTPSMDIPVNSKPVTPPVTPSQPKPRKASPWLALAGLVVALGLLGGGAYVLATGGSRIPLLYTQVSGLPSGGIDVAKKSLAYVTGQTSYQLGGNISVKDQNPPASGALPEAGAGSEAAPTAVSLVTSLSTEISTAVPVRHVVADGTQAGKISLGINDLRSLPIYFTTRAGQSAAWTFNLSANTVNPLVQVQAEDVKKTLAYPALSPMVAKDILGAFTTETSYEKLSGQGVAHYAYDMNAGTLQPFLPEGSVVQSAKGEAYYAWSTAQLLRLGVEVSFQYLNRTYVLKEVLELKNWNQELASGSDSDMDVLLAGTAEPSVQTGGELIPQFGVSLSALPNTLPEEEKVSLPIVPTGETITALTAAIVTVPPLPKSPANEEAKKRDSQRVRDLADLQIALEEYKKEEGSYPVSDGLQQTLNAKTLFDALVPTYISKMPVDPLPSTYWYEYTSNGSSYVLRSASEDPDNPKVKLGKTFYYFEVTN